MSKNTVIPHKCGYKDIAQIIAQNTGCSVKTADSQVRCVIDTICSLLSEGHVVSFSGQFSLEPSVRAERKGRNPKTGEQIVIPESRGIKFKIGSSLKDFMNS